MDHSHLMITKLKYRTLPYLRMQTIE